MAILLNDSRHRPLAGIATDGAHSLKEGIIQYRGVDLLTGRELFYKNLGNKTVNIGEFLGVVMAIKYIIEYNFTPRTIYTDSMTAISWINNKSTSSKKRLPDLKRAEIFLKVMSAEIASINIIHWNTNEWGGNPRGFWIEVTNKCNNLVIYTATAILFIYQLYKMKVMPKIGKDIFVIKNENVSVEIHYSQKNGFYYKGVPEEVYSLTSFGSQRYQDEGVLKQHPLRSLAEYHDKSQNFRKVIAYHLYGSTQLILNRLEGLYTGYSGIKPGVSSKFDHKLDYSIENMFGFTSNVLIEVTGRIVEYYYVKENDTPGGIYKFSGTPKEIIIDWTKEREQFFVDLRGNLQNLVYNVSSFFDRPDLLQLIDSQGIRMLEGSSGNTSIPIV